MSLFLAVWTLLGLVGLGECSTIFSRLLPFGGRRGMPSLFAAISGGGPVTDGVGDFVLQLGTVSDARLFYGTVDGIELETKTITGSIYIGNIENDEDIQHMGGIALHDDIVRGTKIAIWSAIVLPPSVANDTVNIEFTQLNTNATIHFNALHFKKATERGQPLMLQAEGWTSEPCSLSLKVERPMGSVFSGMVIGSFPQKSSDDGDCEDNDVLFKCGDKEAIPFQITRPKRGAPHSNQEIMVTVAMSLVPLAALMVVLLLRRPQLQPYRPKQL